MSSIDKIREFIVREARGVKSITKEYADVIDQIQKHLEAYKQTKGTTAEKQHIQQLKQLNSKKKALADELDKKVSGLYKDVELKADVDEMNTSGAAGPYNTPFAFGKPESEEKKGKRQADLTGYSVVKENRWLELKKDESTAQAKIGRGISNINKQLAEMERFLNWYGKIKNESGVDNKSYWKRTNSHIYSIKERLLKLDQKIRQISE